jgi:hypothetical protein
MERLMGLVMTLIAVQMFFERYQFICTQAAPWVIIATPQCRDYV